MINNIFYLKNGLLTVNELELRVIIFVIFDNTTEIIERTNH